MKENDIVGIASPIENAVSQRFLHKEKDIGKHSFPYELEKSNEEVRFITTTKRFL